MNQQVNKLNELTIDISATSRSNITTNTTFFTMDVETAKKIINFTLDGDPLDLTSATVLLGFEFVDAGTSKIIDSKDGSVEIENIEEGRCSVNLPNHLYEYSGRVYIHTYIMFDDGRSFDAGIIVTDFEESWLDAELEEMTDFYVKRFEDLAEEIRQRADELHQLLDGVDGSIVSQDDFDTHVNDTNNPHDVTIGQIPNLQQELNNRALSNHTHPAQTTITGNAGTATRLQTPRSMGLSGVQATSQNFDGSANINIPITGVPVSLLRGVARHVNGDWNDHRESGLYMGQNLLNAPPRITGANSWFYVRVIQHNDQWAMQEATDLDNRATYKRALRNGQWHEWVLLLDETVGNAVSTSRLQTPRQINGTNFDGSSNITTTSWGAARNITIGNTTRSFDGSANVAWTLADIGAAPITHIDNEAMHVTRLPDNHFSVDVPGDEYPTGLSLMSTDSSRFIELLAGVVETKHLADNRVMQHFYDSNISGVRRRNWRSDRVTNGGWSQWDFVASRDWIENSAVARGAQELRHVMITDWNRLGSVFHDLPTGGAQIIRSATGATGGPFGSDYVQGILFKFDNTAGGNGLIMAYSATRTVNANQFIAFRQLRNGTWGLWRYPSMTTTFGATFNLGGIEATATDYAEFLCSKMSDEEKEEFTEYMKSKQEEGE